MVALGIFLAAHFTTLMVAETSTAKEITSPGRFLDDYDASLASDGSRLWFAVTGLTKKKETRTEVFKLHGDSWIPLPGRPLSTNRSALQLELLKLPGTKRKVPCVGFKDTKLVVQIRCFSHNRWNPISISKSLRRMSFSGMATKGRGLTALFSDQTSTPDGVTTTVQAARLKGHRIRPLGSPLILKKSFVVALGRTTADTNTTNVDVTLENLSEKRFVATLKPSGWTQTNNLPRVFSGTQFGTVRSKSTLFFPVQSAHPEQDWTFSVYRKRNGEEWKELAGSPLNTGSGNAQGDISPVGNRIWAVWEEHQQVGSDDPTQILAARLDFSGSTVEKAIPLWSGNKIYPGVYEATSYRGGPVFMYSRQLSPDGGIFATVDLSHR